MLALQTAVNVVLAVMMMTDILKIPISISFLFVPVILTLEMSLASPGTTACWVISFEAFSIPTSYVGIFSTCRIFANNYSSFVEVAVSMLEEYEVACKMDAIVVSGEP